MISILNSLVELIPSNFTLVFEIGIMIIVAGILAFIFKLMRQPRIPAYVIAGIILGPLALGVVENSEVIRALSEIGVAFLLFFAGLEISFKSLKQVGKIATATGILEMAIMAGIAIGILFSLGLNNVQILYATLVVAFSSTMVVIKMLSDKHELGTLHGRIIIGILLIQDIVAILALTILTTNFALESVAISLTKAVAFAVVAFVIANISKPFFKVSARSSELLLISSLALLFLFSISAYLLGLSIVIGSFFAGVVLANSPFKTEIKGRVHSLRDFFGAILFVSLGMQLVWIPKEYWGLFGILLVLIMIIKPIAIIFCVRLLKYTNRTAFLSGNYLGQSSEFALIILTQGLLLAHISPNFFSVLVFVTIITMSLTGYFIKYEHILYRGYLRPAKIFSRISTKKEKLNYGLGNNKKIVLIGCHRMGTLILKKFDNQKKNILVIDHDPEIINALIKKKVPCLYGDFGNPEIIEKLTFINPDTIISTIPDTEDNLALVKKIKKVDKKTPVIVVAGRIDDALELYKMGADYVILPKILSGEKIAELIGKVKKHKKNLKQNEIGFLNKIHYFLYKKD